MNDEEESQNWDQLIANKMNKFDQIYLQMRNKLNDKKSVEQQKEARNLIQKMCDKVTELEKAKSSLFDKKNNEKRNSLHAFEKDIEKFV